MLVNAPTTLLLPLNGFNKGFFNRTAADGLTS
jgi:hypothetical protein